MKQMDQWSILQLALFTNTIAMLGIYISFVSSSVKLNASMHVYIAVLTVVFLNLIFLVAGPRARAARRRGQSAQIGVYGALYEALAERPLLTVLCIVQLVGASRSASTTVQILQTLQSGYVRGSPNSGTLASRLRVFSLLMGSVALLWFLAVIGLWIRRSWAWWLALILNSLVAAVTGLLQLAKPRELLLDPWATLAVVLLLLRPVRQLFHPRQTTT
jgi:hypothetical protein